MSKPKTLALVFAAAFSACSDQNDGAMRPAEVDGHAVAYQVVGDGERAVVFVHGWTGNRRHWHHQIDGLELGRRMLFLDLPGHGESGTPLTGYDGDLFARAVAAAMDAASIDRAVLVGHSAGAPVVRHFQRMFPQRTEALVLIDGALRKTLTPELAEWMRGKLEAANFGAVSKELVSQMPRGGISEADFELVKQSFLATPQCVHLAGLDWMTSDSTWPTDPVDVPLLVVMTRSTTIGADYEEFVRSLAPQVEYHQWDCGHLVPMERPDELNALIEAFVAKL